jgi:SAM-dependent methyltransferase
MTASPEAYRYVLIPGRHHVLTQFQARYLGDLLSGRLRDARGRQMTFAPEAEVVWAITSANHANTRRNPIPGNRREVAIELFSLREGLPSLVVPVLDVSPTERFAEITLKAVTAATGESLVLAPATCVVATSTPSVISMYEELGFAIASLELDHPDKPLRAWEVLMLLAGGDSTWRKHAHPSTQDVFDRYGLADQVRMVMSDPLVSAEGALTETRNYGSYAASFEAAAERKWAQARPFIRPGRIVDVGCATGAMLELAAKAPELAESDLYGIEVARHLYEECVHKKAQGAFVNPNTFFYQRNILAGPAFPAASIDTTLTFALTHEIYSYGGGHDALERLVATIFDHTAPGGIWINSDVCGPDSPDRPVRLVFHKPGLNTEGRDLTALPTDRVRPFLESLTPGGRFQQFARDFRRNSGTPFRFNVLDDRTVELTLSAAMEFLSKYTYTENWLSETHEQFCGLSWSDWVRLVSAAGFRVDDRSGPWRNEWLVENIFSSAGRLTDESGAAITWPVTHLLLVASRSPAT